MIAPTRQEIDAITIPQIIRNMFQVYDGDLIRYFKIVFTKAHNVRNPYHNLRHMLHVAWLCHSAIMFYRAQEQFPISKREARNLLIAALFHDYDHTGKNGHDDLEIERAIRGFRNHLLLSDAPYFGEIAGLIRGTEFPHKIPVDELTLCGKILRDADLGQVLSTAWIQQTVVGLSQEWSMPPIEILKKQKPFLSQLNFVTDWANERFGPDVIKQKIQESQDILALLEEAA